jgi:hypothetical protein
MEAEKSHMPPEARASRKLVMSESKDLRSRRVDGITLSLRSKSKNLRSRGLLKYVCEFKRLHIKSFDVQHQKWMSQVQKRK